MKQLPLFTNTPHPKTASAIALGCDHYVTDVPEKQALAVMDAYFTQGGNFLDTAHIYSPGPGGVSLSEKLVGEWIRTNNVRDKITLVTKGAHPNRNTITTSRINPQVIKEEFASSMETLGVDTVDIWFLHRDNPELPAGEILDMAAEATKGRALHLGASNWKASRLAEAAEYAKKKGIPGFAISQIQWSLARSTNESWNDPTIVVMDETEAAWYRERRFPVMAFASQAHGIFSKVIAQGEGAVKERSAKRFMLEENRDRIERCRIVSERTGVNPAGICLAYLTGAEFPTIPVIGCSSPEQVEDSLRFADFALSEADRRFLVE